jgi:hypothetical protein
MVTDNDLLSIGSRKRHLNYLVRSLEKRAFLNDADRELLRAARAELKKVRREEKKVIETVQGVLL